MVHSFAGGRWCLLIVGLLLAAAPWAATAQAEEVYQTVNATLTPAPFYWGAPSGKIGWYWTPATDVELLGIQTRLATGFTNINNNFTATTTLYTDRPAAGGSVLGSFDWHAATPVDGPWLGGEFASALSLTGGTTYFVGMSGWEQVLTGSGGGGVNWIDPPNQAGAESLGAGSGYTGANFEIQMNVGATPANVDSPILRFIAVPEPATLGLLALATPALLARRRRQA